MTHEIESEKVMSRMAIYRSLLTVAQLGLLVTALYFGEISATSLQERWWEVLTPIVSDPGRIAKDLHKINAIVGRGIYHNGWYGYWALDDQRRTKHHEYVWRLLEKLGMRKVLYYDSGEAGDYAIFIGKDGRVVCNGWELPWWDGKEAVTPHWFGLDAFMSDVDWAPYPTAKSYGLPPFTMPDGTKPKSVYDAIARRDLQGQWQFDFFSNPRVTDEIAQKSGLANISSKQEAREDVAEKSGWITVRLVHVDFSNPQLLDYRCREIKRLVREIRPDGVHIDNHGDINILYPHAQAFGVWSVAGFRQWLQKHVKPEQLRKFGIEDVSQFDIREYVLNRRFQAEQKPQQALSDLRWTEDPIWLHFLLFKVESELNFHKAVYQAAKEAASEIGIDLMVSGNVIPLFPARTLLRGSCDIACFEWTMTKQFGPIRPSGLPPEGRVGHATKVGAAISNAGYCWATIYVPRELSGEGHGNLHKMLAFECLANRGLLDYGHWFLDGYSPGTIESIGFVNRFVINHQKLLSKRKPFSDVALVYCPYTELTTITPVGVRTSLFLDEYIGWADFLSKNHFQWDVLLSQDLTAENLKRFSVIILPSIRVLTDEQFQAIWDYVCSGGRVVATGSTGTRFGVSQYLMPRPSPVLIKVQHPRLRVTNAYVGVNRMDEEMKRLLDFKDWQPVLETNASKTVGTYLHWNGSVNKPVLTLDLVNYDIDVATDRVKPTSPVKIALRLPKWLFKRRIDVIALDPELEETGQKAQVKVERTPDNRLLLHVPSFRFYLCIALIGRDGLRDKNREGRIRASKINMHSGGGGKHGHKTQTA